MIRPFSPLKVIMGKIARLVVSALDKMLVDDIGDTTVTNDGKTIAGAQHTAACVLR